MTTVTVEPRLSERIERDRTNAIETSALAKAEAARYRIDIGPIDIRTGVTSPQRDRSAYGEGRGWALQAIAEQPFHAMVELITETEERPGHFVEKEQLWYANEHATTNEVFTSGGKRIPVLAWTHPGVQLALTGRLNDYRSIKANGYRLAGVEPKARARFETVLPEISGLYDPGGSVLSRRPKEPTTGLKAVKLNMTREQVEAFVSRMDGLMIVTGAPGSGKTTVAFQRIRFLFDQQGERRNHPNLASYTPTRTKVFLANPNLVSYSRKLLVDQLGIPDTVVSLLAPFIKHYLDDVWRYKHDARPHQRRLSSLDRRGRAAFFGLTKHSALPELWRVFEAQVANRLQQASSAEWCSGDMELGTPALQDLAKAFQHIGQRAHPGDTPLGSHLRMDALYQEVSSLYERVRLDFPGTERQRFDDAFMRWLFWVYDPLAAMEAYFAPRRSEGAMRIRQGTGFRADEVKVLNRVLEDWRGRQFGRDEHTWLAWLLRFALPETDDSQRRFREVPSALTGIGGQDGRWTHVVIDEAQDLCVAEASLLVSFVDPSGAVTVSADFRQVVSPIHGMVDANALAIGNPLRGGGVHQLFPFARNMRQSRQIGQFLQAFHQAAFHEHAPFEVNDGIVDAKPQLLLARASDHPLRIKQMLAALRPSRAVQSIAMLQINEDEEALMRMRAALENLGVPLAPPWEAFGHGLITTSVERIKGLEFDACVILGLDNVENASLNFTMNRTYVALSRPARRLALLCEEFPVLLQKIDAALYDIRRL